MPHWKLIRKTRGGRRVERRILKPRSALSGILDWLDRMRMARRISHFSDRYFYSYTLTIERRFVGDRRVYVERIELPNLETKNVDEAVLRYRNRRALPRKITTKGEWSIYHGTVQSVIVGIGAWVPGSKPREVKRVGKAAAGGSVFGRRKKRLYAVLKLGIEIERIEKARPKPKKKRRRKHGRK